jgi:hypothetical protein
MMIDLNLLEKIVSTWASRVYAPLWLRKYMCAHINAHIHRDTYTYIHAVVAKLPKDEFDRVLIDTKYIHT